MNVMFVPMIALMAEVKTVMTVAAPEQRYSWNQSAREIYKKLAQNQPGQPDYEKLLVLVQLKTTEAVAGYTKSLMLLTGLIVFCTVVQSVVAVLTYLHPPVH